MKNMVKVLNLAVLALIMFSSNARCDPATKAEGPAVNVAGGVQKPGRYDWFKGMTLFDAIKAAGGLSDPTISTVKVHVTHADHTQVIYPFSPGNDTAKKSPLLQDGDRVFVAKTLNPPALPKPSPKPAN